MKLQEGRDDMPIIASEILKEYLDDIDCPLKERAAILEYAEKRRVLKKVKDRIGVWL